MWLVTTILDSTALDFSGVIISNIKPMAITMMIVTKSFRIESSGVQKIPCFGINCIVLCLASIVVCSQPEVDLSGTS